LSFSLVFQIQLTKYKAKNLQTYILQDYIKSKNPDLFCLIHCTVFAGAGIHTQEWEEKISNRQRSASLLRFITLYSFLPTQMLKKMVMDPKEGMVTAANFNRN